MKFPSSPMTISTVHGVLHSPACNFQGDKTSLTQLKNDCQLLMLNLDLQNLFDIADTNNTLSALSADVFRQKYSNFTFKIDNDGRSSSKSNESNQFPVLMDEKTIVVFGLSTSLRLLKHFGSTIQHLTIHNQRFFVKEEETIIGYVNEYCSQSLIKLDLQITQHNTIKKLTGPFESVEELGLHLTSDDIYGITTRNYETLNNFFPNIQNLTLSITSNTTTYFVGHLPKLKYLTLKGDTIIAQANRFSGVRVETSNTEWLLKENSHIKALKLISYPPDYVITVKFYLPYLESLSLSSFDLGNQRVRFENVKMFELLSAIEGSPKNIAFQYLEELRIWYQPEFAHDWIEFLIRNPHLKRVFVEDYGDNEFTLDLEHLKTELPEIEDMTILSTKSIYFETIIQFIETHEHLHRFKYGSKDFNEHHTEYFKREFDNNWTISDFSDDYTGLIFERNQSIE